MGFKCWFIILHGHIFSQVIKHTRDPSLLLGLYDRHAILNLKVLLEIRQHFFLFFFSPRFLAFAARQITGAERLLCRLLYKLTQLSATTQHHTVNQQRFATSATAEPSESRWSRAPKWDLKKSSNLQMRPNKRLFVRKTTTVPTSDFMDSHLLMKASLLFTLRRNT